MRLKDDHEPLRLQRPRRRQRRRDLRGMVTVVVDDPVRRAPVLHLEPPFGPAKPLKRRADFLERHAALGGQRDHRQRIADVVAAGNVQHQLTERLAAARDGARAALRPG